MPIQNTVALRSIFLLMINRKGPAVILSGWNFPRQTWYVMGHVWVCLTNGSKPSADTGGALRDSWKFAMLPFQFFYFWKYGFNRCFNVDRIGYFKMFAVKRFQFFKLFGRGQQVKFFNAAYIVQFEPAFFRGDVIFRPGRKFRRRKLRRKKKMQVTLTAVV